MYIILPNTHNVLKFTLEQTTKAHMGSRGIGSTLSLTSEQDATHPAAIPQGKYLVPIL
jgi:hypothetical protein